MAWLSVNKVGVEFISKYQPKRLSTTWVFLEKDADGLSIRRGSIKKLIGKDLTWDDPPFNYTWDE